MQSHTESRRHFLLYEEHAGLNVPQRKVKEPPRQINLKVDTDEDDPRAVLQSSSPNRE